MDDVQGYAALWGIHSITSERISRGLHHRHYTISAKEGKYVMTFYDDIALLKEADAVSTYLRRHGVPTLTFKRTKKGELYCRAGKQYVAVTIFIPGDHPKKPIRRELAYELGKVLGRMDAALFQYRSRRKFVNANAIPRRLASMRTHEPTLYKKLDVLYREMRKHQNVRGCRRSFIHQDFTEVNILCNQKKVFGVLDFGDAGTNYLIHDPAIAITHLCSKRGRAIPHLVTPFMRGYSEYVQLTAAERSALFWAILQRGISIATYFWISGHRHQNHVGPKRLNREMTLWGLRSAASWYSFGPQRFGKLLEVS